MNKILNMGKTGLHANQHKMNALATDLANVNTTGYKMKNVSFKELLVNEIKEEDVLISANMDGRVINMGAKSGVSHLSFNQGSIVDSPGDYQLAIEGNGFFGVRDEDDNFLLTRDGNFHINEDLSITDDSGHYLEIDYTVPIAQWGDGDIAISQRGVITKDINGVPTEVGRIVLYYPEVLDSLVPVGENKFVSPENIPLYNSIDQEEMFGNIVQGALESSNVEVSRTMADMITAQRAYSLSARAIQTTDDIMGMINNIKS